MAAEAIPTVAAVPCVCEPNHGSRTSSSKTNMSQARHVNGSTRVYAPIDAFLGTKYERLLMIQRLELDLSDRRQDRNHVPLVYSRILLPQRNARARMLLH
jgi:hypothetical protein